MLSCCAILCSLAVTACDAIVGSKEETEYAAELSGEMYQSFNHGCAVTLQVAGTALMQLREEGSQVRGRGEVAFTGTPISIAGDTTLCRIEGTPPVHGYFAGSGVGGDPDNITWSQTQSEQTAESTSSQSLSFTGALGGGVLTGTLSFTSHNQRVVTDCDSTGCTPRTASSTANWTTEVTATAD